MRHQKREKKVSGINKILFPIKESLETILKDKRIIISVTLTTLFMLYMLRSHRQLFFIILLITLASISRIFIRYFRFLYFIGIELMTFATVLSARVYGGTTGAMVGFITIFLGLIISGKFKHSSFISLIAMPIIGFITPFFGFVSTPTLGIVIPLIYNIMIIPFYLMLGSRISSSIIFVTTNMMFNYWLFKNIAPTVLGWM